MKWTVSDGVAQSTLSSIERLFDDSGVFGRPFLGLETQYQQVKYYSNHFGLIVSELIDVSITCAQSPMFY